MSALKSIQEDPVYSKYKIFLESNQDLQSKDEVKYVLGKHFLLNINKFYEKEVFNKISKSQDANLSKEEEEKLNKDKEFYNSKLINLARVNKECK